jgi:hypothetical protein
MIAARALLIAAAAMLGVGCGAQGLPEPRAPLTLYSDGGCPKHRNAGGVIIAPSEQLSSALMP